MDSNNIKYRIILSGGGTGGHIFPAIAIADAIKNKYKEVELLFIGAKGKMEIDKVPKAGYKIKTLNISGFQRKFSLSNFLLPFKIIISLLQAWFILKKFKPQLVIGVGGYASGPTVLMASFHSIPTLIQEQNSFAGKTNQWLSKKVDKICVAYNNMQKFFPSQKIVLTGNPIRKKIIQQFNTLNDNDYKRIDTIYEQYQLDRYKFTVFAFGGSLGATPITREVLKNCEKWINQDIQIILQIGKNTNPSILEKIKSIRENKSLSEAIRIFSFIEKMEDMYSIANAIICRSGAISISELCIVGKPVIFIPSPYVAEDHQTHNALALVNKNAALMVKENDEDDKLYKEIINIKNNDSLAQQLGDNIKKLAKPQATEDIVKEVSQLLNFEKAK